MNVANLLGLASEALPTPGAPPPAEMAAAARPFPALLADALDEGGEIGTLAVAGLLAGEPFTAAAAAPLANPAASAPATSSPVAPEKPLVDTADPDADDRQTLSALAALPGPFFTLSPLPPPLADAPLDLPQAGLSAWPVPSLGPVAPGAALAGETLPGGPQPGPANKPAALALASTGAAVAAAEVGLGQEPAEVPVVLRPLADAPPLLTVPVDARAATSAAAASAAVGAAATGLPAHALPAGTPMATPTPKRADAAAAPTGLAKEPSTATSAQSAPVPAAAVRPAPATAAPAAAAAPAVGGELPAVAGSAAAAALDEPAPEAQRSDPAPLRQAATDARTLSALADARAGASAGLEAAEAMTPAPEAPALPIQDLPERALRIASELRADGAKHYRAELQLDPPGLGRVRIEIEMSVQETGDAERSLTRITVETAAAHEQLQAELPRLRALLADQGLGEAQVELQLRQDQGNGQGTEEQQSQRSLRQAGEADERERSGRRLEWRSTHDGLIDLRA
jgi:flagellar hook-length control protein FliK